jgi:hypothetical protein
MTASAGGSAQGGEMHVLIADDEALIRAVSGC